MTIRAILSQSEVCSGPHAFRIAPDRLIFDKGGRVASAAHEGAVFPFQVEPGALMVKPAGIEAHEHELPAMMFLVAFDALSVGIGAVKTFAAPYTHSDIIMARKASCVVDAAAERMAPGAVVDALQMRVRRREGSGRDLCMRGLRHDQPHKKKRPCSQHPSHHTTPTSSQIPPPLRHAPRGSRK